MGNRWKTLVPGALVLAGAASGIGWSVAPASAATDSVAAECRTTRTTDGKWISVSCTTGRYYVIGSACSAGGCTTIGGPVVNAPGTSSAYAGSGFFSRDFGAVFV